ncbi:Aspartyl aminopeptidase [Ruminococcaceae bacterium YRB3002]|nr:Aspartyl aminopeptidase [Ruminococcaceae bacterium YRB3002]
MAEKKKSGKKSKELELAAEFPNLYKTAGKAEISAAMDFAEDYKAFLDISKTEREFVKNSIEAARELGFVDIEHKKTLKAGDKVYKSVKGKGLALAVIGVEPCENGFNILGAHVDSPRLDLKPNPLYEDNETVYFKTHYYGGIKKYQWTTIPLALHGVVYTAGGNEVEVCVGEDPSDPVFYITDLLIHLGNEQMGKKASEVVTGEDLNLVIGGIPVDDKDVKDPYKAAVLKILNDKYGIVEKDFVSAELEVVPADKARDVGFDRAYIAAYGHDDKVCAYPALMSLFSQEKPKRTCVTILTDKEEIGSYANSGAQSAIYENFLMELLAKNSGGIDKFNMLVFRKAMENTKMLSTDVTSAYDPKYASVYEARNTAYMSRGLKIEKYTGARGKSGSSEANGDFVAKITEILKENSIPWQTGELGKIDVGGGGTISAYMAKSGMDVLDMGIPVWSMHAPIEVISKIDLYYLYLAYKAFIENMR